MSRTRKALLGMLVVGGLAAAGGGTFAAFSASTTNAGSTFATGTLVLSNQKNSGSACLSTAGGSTDTNANSGCDQLFAVTVQKPGDAATVNLTLQNAGSLDASALRTFANAACAASNASGQSYNGTGDPCGSIAVYVQEFSDSGRTTASTCHYGGGNATTCGYDSAETLATFSSTYADAGSALGLGAHTGGASRYFTIGVQMNSTAGNDMQGRTATFGFTWQLAQ